MALGDAGGEGVDRGTVADVAHLDLRAELPGERAQPLLAPGDEDAAPAVGAEQPGDLGPDPARPARDDGD